LSEEETGEYIRHRLSVAGCGERVVFPVSAIPMIYQYTGGVPRLANILCDAAMVAAYVEGVQTVTEALIHKALDELGWTSYAERMKGREGVAVEPHEEGPKLVLSKKGFVIEDYGLDKERVLVGRSIKNDIVLEESVVSGHHAAIYTVDGAVVVEDLDSTNGTYVNAKRIKKCVLYHGDRIGITPYQLTYVNPLARRLERGMTKVAKMSVSGASNS
jgi:hypothetical protein